MSSFQTILAGLRDVSERVLQELSTLTVTVSGAVSALDKAKADKVTLTAFTIPTTGWQQDGNYGYPYYVDLPVSGLTENDVVAVEITPAGQNVAETACFLSSSESLSGVLRLRAKHIPTAALAAYYYIIREDLLMAFGPLAVGTTPYALPPATATTLGGVKAGPGLNITPDGTLSAAEQYALPAATATTLGGVKVGEALDIAPDGTLSAKTLNDKIAAAVAVKSEARLVWSGKTTIGRKKTQTINVQDGVDYVNLRINEADFNLTPGMTYETGSFGAGSLTVTVLFSADKKRLECTLTNTLNTVSVVFTGYHYPTLADLLTETQAAQADTDALAVDHEYRVAMLELGMTDDTTTDTTT